ncbi:hypothetical protein [Chamaesiphon minutus]|uniref:Uncharacterized protein n=1 Tax=Chamaesiphon minutus (strain ATCC 27169 / PCC 6605) TaxID=1173020 RepID=K9ULY1_CHAP6|nr:hypothetical protein [Chamaesiphon minutus]AFY95800.1 hypothetical protein Cha6605_4889 [Chamaesiphon minutus PCC 6605]
MPQVITNLKSFTVETFQNLVDRESAEANIEATVELAAASPEGLYYFMQRYAHFNGFAGSLVARLASSIGLSRDLFNQPGIPVVDRADRGLDIAAKVLAATIDEHADSGAQQVTHRTLAQATMQAIGDYAGLSDLQCNQIAQTPEWMNDIITDLVSGYQGKIGDLQALVTAVGFHIGSELLADREYSLIDKVVRHNNRGVGFDRYLQGKQVEIGGKRLSPWYWIVVHGKHNSTGVEAEHCQLAIDALNAIVEYRPESAATILEWASTGFIAFAQLQQRLFFQSKIELQTLKTRRLLESGAMGTLGSMNATFTSGDIHRTHALN